jgi:hypothetical protein
MEVLDSLGPPQDEDKAGRERILYYRFHGVDHDTALSFLDNKLHYIHLSGFPQVLTFYDFRDFFSMAEVQAARDRSGRGISHEAGRFVDLTSTSRGLSVRLSNSPTLQVRELTVFAPGATLQRSSRP